MTKRLEFGTKVSDEPVIEITPAMIEAGVSVLRSRFYGSPMSETVEEIFLAMALEGGLSLP